jgi:hypothetical protein
MMNVIELSERMREIVAESARKRGHDVAAASPWVQGNLELPHRIVLRDTASAWVVHRQIIDTEADTAYFESGNYFPRTAHFDHKTGPDVSGAFTAAWRCFEQRSRRHLGLNWDDTYDAEP